MFVGKNVMFSWFCLQLLLCIMFAQANTAEATLCAPLSRFKIDCNTCYCSVDGSRYTCTKRFCTSDVSLNYNDFMADAPDSNERIYYDDDSDDWARFLNDLAANQEESEHRFAKEHDYDFDANSIDYGDYLKDDTEYIGSRKHGYRF